MRSHDTSVASIAAHALPRPVPRAGRRVLNIGSGHRRPGRLHAGFDSRGWREVRLDIDPAVKPDLIGSVLDMRGLVPDSSVDAIWCSHVLEHLDSHDVLAALAECRRVLKPDGFALVTSPDLTAVARRIVEVGLEETAYVSAAGPIAPLDMLFGHGASVAAGNGFMAHRTGFTADRLGRLATKAGFAEAQVACGAAYDLWAVLLMPDAEMRRIEPLFAETDVGRLLF